MTVARRDAETDSVFHVTAETQLTHREQFRRLLDLWVVAPFLIMWDDYRTRVGVLIVGAYVLMGTVGVVVLPAPQISNGPRLLPAFQQWQFPLGTDGFGKGLLRVTIHSTPAMLKMILSGSIFATSVATIIGTISGFKSGTLLDKVLMTFTDIMMTIPGLPLIIVVAIALKPKDPFMIGLILVINVWAGLARTIRSQVLQIREEAYVEASQVIGVPTPQIILSDILPNIMPYILINFTQSARNVIFSSVGLYFLGLLPFTTLNWGVMLNMARQAGALQSPQAFHWLFVPMVTIMILTFGLIMLAQGMDKLFNPRVRARHADTIETE